ncbi:unnamed protein product [Caretta caretta]
MAHKEKTTVRIYHPNLGYAAQQFRFRHQPGSPPRDALSHYQHAVVSAKRSTVSFAGEPEMPSELCGCHNLYSYRELL